MPRVDFEDMCTKLWGLWKDQCTFLHKENPQGVSTRMSLKASWTEVFLATFCEAQIKHTGRGLPLTSRYSFDPSLVNSHCFSAYVDAAYKDSTSSYATFFVIYDPRGKLRAAVYNKISLLDPSWRLNSKPFTTLYTFGVSFSRVI